MCFKSNLRFFFDDRGRPQLLFFENRLTPKPPGEVEVPPVRRPPATATSPKLWDAVGPIWHVEYGIWFLFGIIHPDITETNGMQSVLFGT
jgi:hypothetical protein